MKNTKLKLLVGTSMILDYTIDNKAIFVGKGATEFAKEAVANFKESCDNPLASWFSKDKGTSIDSKHYFLNLAEEFEKRLQYPEYSVYNERLIVAEIESAEKLVSYLKQTDELPQEIGFIFYSEKELDFDSFGGFFDAQMFFRPSKNAKKRSCGVFARHSDNHEFKALKYETCKLYPDWLLGRLVLRNPEIFDILGKLRNFGVDLVAVGLNFTGDFYSNIKRFEKSKQEVKKSNNSLRTDELSQNIRKIYRYCAGLTEKEVDFINVVLGVDECLLHALLKRSKTIDEVLSQSEEKELEEERAKMLHEFVDEYARYDDEDYFEQELQKLYC